MNLLIFTTIMLWFSGCGSEKDQRMRTDPLLKPYVTEFFKILKENNVRTPKRNYAELTEIKLSITSAKHLYGKCRIDENTEEINNFNISSAIERSVIIYPNNINRDFPDSSQEMMRLVVFHELIHCVFEREHDHENIGLMATDLDEILRIYKDDAEKLVDFSLQADYISGLNRIQY